MKEFIKTYWKTLLFFAVIGLIGGMLVKRLAKFKLK